jgi:uncharacterized membrane protein
VVAASDRSGLAGRRTVVALLGAAVTLTVALLVGAAWPIALSASWGIAAVVIVVWVWARVGWMDPATTRAHARAEDFSRPSADAAVLAASVTSLVAVGYTIITAGNREGTTKALLILLALSVVALSWLTVHTLYMLRYGDTYYADPIGGIDFNEEEPPSYRDFAYVAFTIGMTFQVSDTSLTSQPMRRLALRHALLSFVFGAVILALTINSVASLLQ